MNMLYWVILMHFFYHTTSLIMFNRVIDTIIQLMFTIFNVKAQWYALLHTASNFSMVALFLFEMELKPQGHAFCCTRETTAIGNKNCSCARLWKRTMVLFRLWFAIMLWHHAESWWTPSIHLSTITNGYWYIPLICWMIFLIHGECNTIQYCLFNAVNMWRYS